MLSIINLRKRQIQYQTTWVILVNTSPGTGHLKFHSNIQPKCFKHQNCAVCCVNIFTLYMLCYKHDSGGNKTALNYLHVEAKSMINCYNRLEIGTMI